MNDSLGMRGRKAIGDRLCDLDRVAPRKGGGVETPTKRLSFEQLGNGIGDAMILAEVVNGQDVRV